MAKEYTKNMVHIATFMNGKVRDKIALFRPMQLALALSVVCVGHLGIVGAARASDAFEEFQALCTGAQSQPTMLDPFLDRAHANRWNSVEISTVPSLDFLATDEEMIQFYPNYKSTKRYFMKTTANGKLIAGIDRDDTPGSNGAISCTVFALDHASERIQKQVRNWLGQSPTITLQPGDD